ncbi:MAG: hypothetical protein ACI85O_001998 [Saprospiraceae bacterium]|jgi:hypothetical protein
MAFPKKGLRKIIVDEIEYGYVITGNDGYIDFAIELLNENGEILTGTFSYNENRVANLKKNGEVISWSGHQRIKITPNTIRQLIEYGLKNEWNPQKNQGQVRLGYMDDRIEFEIRSHCDLEPIIEENIEILSDEN